MRHKTSTYVKPHIRPSTHIHTLLHVRVQGWWREIHSSATSSVGLTLFTAPKESVSRTRNGRLQFVRTSGSHINALVTVSGDIVNAASSKHSRATPSMRSGKSSTNQVLSLSRMIRVCPTSYLPTSNSLGTLPSVF